MLPPVPLSPGDRLGRYAIVSPLGAGGMGEVYRARDAALDRDVAVKVLSAQLAGDPDALARFEREATSIAKLSHPNILAIYEFGRDGATAFVAMELVEGETLRARLDRRTEGGAESAGAARTGLGTRKAIAYALQIARGIAAAHARGIVHRDLKPENVMIGRDDQVKILDFGLAKPVATGGSEMTRAGVPTSAGTVLGSFGYMAPEQVRGLAVDPRADMFAFGAVLYEMLTGERAFSGATAADTMTAILTKEPPELDTDRLSIPPALDRIVRRCLEKAPELRFQSANDLAFALETLTTGSSASASGAGRAIVLPPARSGLPAWLPWAVAALAVVAAAASWLSRRPGVAATGARWSTFTRVTDAAGEETSPTLSPDGGTVAYAVRVGGSWDIYAQRVGGRNATALVNDPQRDERAPAFSPDGSRLAFHDGSGDGGIFVAGATGESVRRVTDVGFDPAWSPDGKSLAFATEEVDKPASRKGDSSIYIVDAAGGTPRKVVDGDGVQPSWSPAGDRLVYWSNTGGQRDIYTVAVAGGPRVAVTQDAAMDWSAVWSPDGTFIYFSSDRGGDMNLWRIPVDASTGAATGEPEPVTTGVQATAALPSFSRDGSRLAFRSRVASTNPVAIPFDPATLRAGAPFLLDTSNNIRVPSDVSPDGTRIAYFDIGERQEDLFVGPVAGPMRRVIDDAARDRAPIFTPDGRSFVFYSTRDGDWGLWAIDVDGGNLHKLATTPQGAVYPLLSPKGDTVVFTSGSGREAFSVSLSSSGAAPVQLPNALVDGAALIPTSWSPDGRRLAGGMTLPSGRISGVGIYDLATHTTTVVSPDDPSWVRWLADGRRVIYFTKGGWQLVVLDTVTRARTVVDVRLPGPSIDDVFALSPDNRTIYYGALRSEADIWIAERK
jgi:eukaryotic-like serine/threonine-protein kinase